MWIFGGYGQSPVSYLNDHGDFAGPGDLGMNNQLFSYNPSMQTFTNMECSREVPSPCAYASSAVIKHKSWLYELNWGHQDHELYELNMQRLTWTHIHTSISKPQVLTAPRAICATSPLLTTITTNHLLLHGQSRDGKDTWMFDVESYQWREFRTETCYCIFYRCSCVSGLNSDVIVLVAHTDIRCNKSIYSLMLEPKSLQQLAMRIIHQNKTNLPWTYLPPQLRRKLET